MTHRLIFPAALVACLANVAPAAGPEAPDLKIEAYRLPNGLKVVLHRDPAVPRVTVCVAYHVGSKDERAGRTGFAHFFEHMMFRGTKNVPNYDIPLQEAGASSNAFTSEDMTVYFETVPSNFLDRALYLEAERLAFLPSALDQSKFDTEREVVKNERRQSYENVPYGLAEEAILANLYPAGHPYSWSVIGSMRDLQASSLDDLRRFFVENYHPGNATLCLVGDFDPADAKAKIAKYFGPLAAGPDRKAVVAPPSPARAVRLELADRVTAPRVYLAWPTPADDHPDTPALDILADILANGEASRLHRALVLDARSATDVDAGSDTKEIAGLFTIQATAAEGRTVEEIKKTIAAEVDRLRAEAPSADEMVRALAKYEKATFQALTAPLGRAITLVVGSAMRDDPAHYRRDFLRHLAVTPADVRRVAEKYLVPDHLQLVIRPAKPGEAESEAVQAGPPSAPAAAEAPTTTRTPAAGPDWAAMPGPSEARPFTAPKFVRRRLSNGLDVWAAPWKTLPIASARLIIPAGTADDPEGKTGLATLAASLLDKGTAKRSAVELAEAFEALGTAPAVSAGGDHTSIGVSTTARNLAPALALVGEMLTSPRVDPRDVERERGLQLAGLIRGPDNAGWIARRAFRALLHGGEHPYGRPADGRPETVKNLNADDVRAFLKGHFAPEGATLVAVGDFEPEALFAELEKALGGWKAEVPGRPSRAESTAKPEPGVVYLVDKPGAVQSVIAIGRRWAGRSDPRYFATLLGNRVLGADFLSRLNQNLRERNGYTYGAGSAFAYRPSGSTWAVNTSVRADATGPALKEIIGELDGLAGAKPLTEEEVDIARDAEVRSFPEGFEDPSGIAGSLEEIALFGLPEGYLDTILPGLQAAQLDQIRAAMTAVADPKSRTILVVGDRKVVGPQLEAAGFRDVRLVDPDGRPAAR